MSFQRVLNKNDIYIKSMKIFSANKKWHILWSHWVQLMQIQKRN